VTWRFVLIETVLEITIQRPTCNTSIHLSSVQTAEAFDCNVSKRTWIFTSLFRNLSSPLHSKEITAFLRHSEQCLFPYPQNAFCFTNLSHLVLEIFRFCEYHAQNLNTLQKNLASWDLQLGFNSAFKGLIKLPCCIKLAFQVISCKHTLYLRKPYFHSLHLRTFDRQQHFPFTNQDITILRCRNGRQNKKITTNLHDVFE